MVHKQIMYCIFTQNYSDRRADRKFEIVPLDKFWIAMQSECDELSQTAIHLCETSFSAMVLIKSKQRNRLKAELEHAMPKVKACDQDSKHTHICYI